MGWTAHHRRGDVLRAVSAAADARRDGVLPLDVAGVQETFGDDRTLLAALQLTWHARLAARAEEALDARRLDRESAARHAWTTAAEDLPGVRQVLDRSPHQPDEEAATRDHLLLASVVGRGPGPDIPPRGGEVDPGAVDVGARLERLARTDRAAAHRATHGDGPAHEASVSLLDRLRAVLPV